MMLAVAAGHYPSVAGSTASSILLAFGGLCGVAAIAAYYWGYRESFRYLAGPLPIPGTALAAAGCVALFGAATHGLTAIDIAAAFAAGQAQRPPEVAFSDPGSPLFLCALLSVLATLVVACYLVRIGLLNCRAAVRRIVVLLNPVCATLALTGAASLAGELAPYIQPAAPNLGHLLFFATLACIGKRGARTGTGESPACRMHTTGS